MCCNLGNAGDGFLGDVADGLITFTEISFNGERRFPTQSIGDAVDGMSSSAKSNSGGDSIGVRDKSFNVDAQIMRGVGVVGTKASCLLEVLDVFASEKMEQGARVVAAEHAYGVARRDPAAECLGSS